MAVDDHMETKILIALCVLALGLAGCGAQSNGAAAGNGTENMSQLYSQLPNQSGGQSVGAANLTLIKFHGNSQCTSCINLGKFAKAKLEKNYAKELASGQIRYLDINAEADTANPYVQKYQPTRASLYLLTESAGGEKFEELAEAWYYTGDEAKYEQYLSGVITERLGG